MVMEKIKTTHLQVLFHVVDRTAVKCTKMKMAPNIFFIVKYANLQPYFHHGLQLKEWRAWDSKYRIEHKSGKTDYNAMVHLFT